MFKFVNNKKIIIYLIIAILAYLAGEQKIVSLSLEKIFGKEINFANTSYRNEEQEDFPFLYSGKVTYVVDGDTIHVTNEEKQEEIVRIMAINTLEKDSKDEKEKCFANRQTDFTKNYLLGKEVFLFSDRSQPKYDKYSRLLAYVSTSSNLDYSYNEYLLDTGNAKVYRANPEALKVKDFSVKETKAKNAGLGMWKGICE